MGSIYFIPNDLGLSQEEVEAFSRIREVVSQMPSPKAPPKPESETPAGYTACACNQKCIPMEDVRYYRTGVIKTDGTPLVAPDTLCRQCRGEGDKMALIVCFQCEAVVARLAPHVTPDTGFPYRAGRCYHVRECGLCNPDCEKSTVVEKQLYDRNQAERRKAYSIG